MAPAQSAKAPAPKYSERPPMTFNFKLAGDFDPTFSPIPPDPTSPVLDNTEIMQ